MTCKEAARLIDPDTCTEALEEYKRHGEEVALKLWKMHLIWRVKRWSACLK